MLGVCIKYYHENYGGMLQAYATISVLEKLGMDYELINYVKHDNVVKKIKYIPRLFNAILLNDKKELLQKKISFKIHKEVNANNAIRLKKFAEFRDEKFKSKISKPVIGYNELQNYSKKFDTILVGSDQLWSPAGLPTNFYNLNFASDGIKKVSYASSFGVKKIPWYQIGRTRKFLNKFDYISMRENAGKEIVKELTGKNVPVVLDPVLLLEKKEWDKLIPNRTIYNQKYVFAYFLGNNIEHRRVVTNFAKENGLKVVTLRHLDQYIKNDETFGDYGPYDIGPEEFLNLIRNAEYIFTDSYHGSVFSMIYQKKFIVFNRYNSNAKFSKNSRIDTLCKNFALTACRYKPNMNIKKELKKLDYKLVTKKYSELRKISEDFLNKSLVK